MFVAQERHGRSDLIIVSPVGTLRHELGGAQSGLAHRLRGGQSFRGVRTYLFGWDN